MILIKAKDDVQKVNTKKELIELLKQYQGILNSTINDYLFSLINLETSAVKDLISDNDSKALEELEIYKKVLIYNIYNRMLNIINGLGHEFEIIDNKDGVEGLHVYDKDKEIKLFSFDYNNDFLKTNVSHYASSNLAKHQMEIMLYHAIHNDKVRKQKLEELRNELEILANTQNPFHHQQRIVGDQASNWSITHTTKMNSLKDAINEISEKKDLTEKEQKELELTKMVYDSALEEFGLTNDSFEEDIYIGKDDKSHKLTIKKYPSITIKNTTHFIY